jgi:hypothetical protein
MAVLTPAWVVNNNDQFVGGIFTTEAAATAFAEACLPNGSTPVIIIPVTRVTEDPA